MSSNDESRRLGYRDAAAHLGIPVGSLKAMVSRKVVPHIRIGPRSVVFDVADLDAYLASRRVTVAA